MRWEKNFMLWYRQTVLFNLKNTLDDLCIDKHAFSTKETHFREDSELFPLSAWDCTGPLG